ESHLSTSAPGLFSMHSHFSRLIIFTVTGAWFTAVTAGAVGSLDPALLTAGTFTTFDAGVDSFARPGSPLDVEQMKQFVDGKAKFSYPWGVSPRTSVVW